MSCGIGTSCTTCGIPEVEEVIGGLNGETVIMTNELGNDVKFTIYASKKADQLTYLLLIPQNEQEDGMIVKSYRNYDSSEDLIERIDNQEELDAVLNLFENEIKILETM